MKINHKNYGIINVKILRRFEYNGYNFVTVQLLEKVNKKRLHAGDIYDFLASNIENVKEK